MLHNALGSTTSPMPVGCLTYTRPDERVIITLTVATRVAGHSPINISYSYPGRIMLIFMRFSPSVSADAPQSEPRRYAVLPNSAPEPQSLSGAHHTMPVQNHLPHRECMSRPHAPR